MITIRNSSLDFDTDENYEKSQLSRSRNGLSADGDTVLILALIILLYSDNGDRLLILALIYIMS